MEDDRVDPAAPASDGPVSGLFRSISNLFATLIAIAQTRIELLTTELQSEVQRSGEIIVWTLVALLAANMALLWIAIVVVVALWDSHRLLAGLSVVAFFSLTPLARAPSMNDSRILAMTFGSFLPMALRSTSACPSEKPASACAMRITCSW